MFRKWWSEKPFGQRERLTLARARKLKSTQLRGLAQMAGRDFDENECEIVREVLAERGDPESLACFEEVVLILKK